MISKKYLYLFSDLGPTYFIYRGKHLFNAKTGYLKRNNTFSRLQTFPVSLDNWWESTSKYLFFTKNELQIPKTASENLKLKAEKIFNGEIQYFNDAYIVQPLNRKWHTNPLTGATYNSSTHWLEIEDFEAGNDIKYVWERSRFCYLYDIIRYDYHFETECSEWVILEILNWIQENPLHLGPNYMSGQEVALRILNWLFAIYYYAESNILTEANWQTIMCAIHDQIKHIHNNLDFAQQLVRNNHIITEAAALFVYSTLFPQLPESEQLNRKSTEILIREANFQIFNDGTYLQYSMNYHRAVVQVYTLVLRIAELNNKKISESVSKKLTASINFLSTCADSETGMLPNYGVNDGSLFFPLNDNAFGDFRPQLQALAQMLNAPFKCNTIYEDTFWFNATQHQPPINAQNKFGIKTFEDSGYYTFRDEDSFTFIRCGKHLQRPGQADNLHVDLWYKSQNIMRDAGTYQYNGEPEMLKYFFGTASHNTLMLENFDQMLKGPRFLWFYYSRFIAAEIKEDADAIIFTGKIKAFRQSGKWHLHERIIKKLKSKTEWIITDIVKHNSTGKIHQHWHPNDNFMSLFTISALDENNQPLTATNSTGYYSPAYGKKYDTTQLTFSTSTNRIQTTITLI